MKKWVGFLIIFVSFATLGFSSKYSINFNMDYNYGVSDYFDVSTAFYSTDGKNFRETRDNRMGFGFSLSATIPVMDRLCVVPGISLIFGHQNYEFQEIPEAESEEAEVDTYFFTILSGRVSLLYDLLRFKSNWSLNALLGLNYNNFSPDQGMREEDDTYWSVRAGLGATFFELKRFGFQVLGFYEFPFSGDRFTFIGIQVGINYRF